MSETTKGVCSVCGEERRVRLDGNVGWHLGKDRDWTGFRTVCDGGGQPPVVSREVSS